MNAPVFHRDYKKIDRASNVGSVLGFIAFLILLIICAAEWPSDECITDKECQSMETGQ